MSKKGAAIITKKVKTNIPPVADSSEESSPEEVLNTKPVLKNKQAAVNTFI